MYRLPPHYPPPFERLFTCSKSAIGTMCEIWSKLTVMTPERRRSGVFIFVNLKHISKLFFVFLLLTLRLEYSSGIQGIFEFDSQFIRRTG